MGEVVDLAARLGGYGGVVGYCVGCDGDEEEGEVVGHGGCVRDALGDSDGEIGMGLRKGMERIDGDDAVDRSLDKNFGEGRKQANWGGLQDKAREAKNRQSRSIVEKTGGGRGV